jgi:hypothetical protein
MEGLYHFLSNGPDSFSISRQSARIESQGGKEQTPKVWFYEIRNSNNAVPKRDRGFPTQDAAKIAGREDAKKMKNMLFK